MSDYEQPFTVSHVSRSGKGHRMNGFRFGARVQHRTSAMRTFIQDLRFAVRILSGSPGFTIVAVLTLALGIASATTVFSWIVRCSCTHTRHCPERSSGRPGNVHCECAQRRNVGLLARLHRLSRSIETGFRSHPTALLLADHRPVRRRPSGMGGTGLGRYFEVLGVRPLLGRLLVSGAHADVPGRYPVIVISERLWRGYFGSDPKVIGKLMVVNRRPLTIIGVTPARFRGPRRR